MARVLMCIYVCTHGDKNTREGTRCDVMTCLEGELEPVGPRALRGGARDDSALDGERHAVSFQGASKRGGGGGGVSGTSRQGDETAVSHRVWLVVVVVAVVVCTSFVCMRDGPTPSLMRTSSIEKQETRTWGCRW